MKSSYTWLCPRGHPPFSYAPDAGEVVRRIFTTETIPPCNATCTKLESKK